KAGLQTALRKPLSDADKGDGMDVVKVAGVGAELPIVASAALRFLERRRWALVSMARAVRWPALPPALPLPKEAPTPRRAGPRRGAEAGERAARSSRKSARRRRSESRPPPVGGAIRRRSPRAIEEGGAASRAPLRSMGLSRDPRRARPATLATVAAGVSRETPPAAGRDGSPRAARARNLRRRRTAETTVADAARSVSGWRNVVSLKTSLSKIPAHFAT